MNYYFKYPINLNIDAVLEENTNIPIKDKVLHKEKSLFIIDAIMSPMLATRQEIMYIKKKEYYSLSSDLLKLALHDYNHYLQLLIIAGIIETDNTYLVGNKCKGFCFSDVYNINDFKSYTVTKYSITKGITRQQQELNSRYCKNTKGYSYLTKWLTSGKLDINVNEANRWIEEDKANELKNLELPISTIYNNNEELLTKEERIVNINNRAANFKYHVQSIHNGTYKSKFAGEGHRFYNPLTNLKKELRNYLSYDGQPLVNIDISNSQPFFAILLHDISFWQKFFFLLGREREEEKEKVKQIIMFLKSSKTHTSKGFENNIDLIDTNYSVNAYIKAVTNGNFYQQLNSRLQPLLPNRLKTDKDIKPEVLRMMYVDNKFIHLPFYEPAIRVFKQMFPVTYHIFYILKSIKCEPKNNYLPILLQKIESSIMIDTVCKTISQQYPTIPLFTIHDSIVTTVSNQAIVTQIMIQTIKEAVGYAPELKAELLAPKGLDEMPKNSQWTCNSTESLKPRKTVINATTRKSFKVLNKATGEIFNTIKEAAKELGINYCTCRNMLSGANKNTTSLKRIFNKK